MKNRSISWGNNLKVLLASICIVFSLMASSVMAVDYFADGCRVEVHGGKLIKTKYGYRRGNLVRCQQFIIKTERGRERALTDDYAST